MTKPLCVHTVAKLQLKHHLLGEGLSKRSILSCYETDCGEHVTCDLCTVCKSFKHFVCLLPRTAGKTKKPQHRNHVQPSHLSSSASQMEAFGFSFLLRVNTPPLRHTIETFTSITVACSASYFSHSDTDRSIYDTLLGFM